MRYITIDGNIGVGKTTLATKLAADYKAKLIPEHFGANPFLPKFYENPERYSFQLELSFLIDRYNQIQNEVKGSRKPLLIADYCFTKSAIFAEKTLPNDEFCIFKSIYSVLLEKIPEPDLYVYLHANSEKLKKNILKRGRGYEKNISNKYLTKIESGYFSYINNISNFPVLFIDMNTVDFVTDPDYYDKLKNAVFNSGYKLGINRLVLG